MRPHHDEIGAEILRLREDDLPCVALLQLGAKVDAPAVLGDEIVQRSLRGVHDAPGELGRRGDDAVRQTDDRDLEGMEDDDLRVRSLDEVDGVRERGDGSVAEVDGHEQHLRNAHGCRGSKTFATGTRDAANAGMAAVSTHQHASSLHRRMVDDLLAELRQHARFAPDARDVQLVETHISWVLLGTDVFKVKKPVTLPFVDFSTIEARERACRTEVRINRRLAPRTYLGVVPIRRRFDGRYTFGPNGAIVDWAVRMRRLDDAQRADVLVESGALDRAKIDALAHGIAAFHADAKSDVRIAAHATPAEIERNVTDNFDMLREENVSELERWQLAFVRGHRDLLEERMRSGAIRDGHGDLRLEHVFFRDGNDFDVIDGVEFDDAYRCADVAADVAFLAMDLARLGRVDLAERFVAMCAREANDFELYRVIDFYESYRACIRAKIAALASAEREARRYLLLAQSVRRRSILDPVLVVVAGGIASGKSTIAERLAEDLSAPIVDADRTRKHMLGLAPTAHDGAGTSAWQGAYAPAFTDEVYAEVLRRADAVLSSGRPVILEASFRTRRARAAARDLAISHGVPFRLIECVATKEIQRSRLAARDPRTSVSDATLGILDDFTAGWEPVNELPSTEHIPVDTSGTTDASLARVQAVVETWPRGLVR